MKVYGGDYYDLNNDTLHLTPYLSSQKDRLCNFGLASAGANCSTESNIILRFGVNPDHIEQSFKTNPYIWQFARQAGYRTIMIEGQAKKGKLNNRMTADELRYIDEFIYPEGESSYEKDLNIAEAISKLTSHNNSKPVFIYAVKAGLHFPYTAEVPRNKAKFKIDYADNSAASRVNMVNSYKNGIAYLIDPFFKALLQNNTYGSSILLYTSDHGQNLLDNGNRQHIVQV
jgi:glucan phosphoethanolaminetransferase (alkaline phosphatase superfamily)